MRVFFVVCSILAVGVQRQLDDEWIDHTDMFNYDPTTKTMRKPPEEANYQNVPTKRREYTGRLNEMVLCTADIMECQRKVAILEKEVHGLKKKTESSSQKSSCGPVFKRYLTRLLKEIQKLGLPNEVSDTVHYDAEVKLSRQDVAEIQKLIDGDESWKTGALDDALSQILVSFKHHDYEAWKWRFEDTFCVELTTVLGVCTCVLLIVSTICSEMWSRVAWFVQFKRMFAVCFFISIIWNWFYLYKSAFAEHEKNIVRMESVNEKCTRKMDWKDNLMEWLRSTWTLQDDPCKKYYEVLMVNPILLVPPTKAISVTITTFFTEPLKHIGEGISEFLRALLKDLPITLQIPVLLTIVLSILVFLYGSTHAVIQHGLRRSLRTNDSDPPQPALEGPSVPWFKDDAGYNPQVPLQARQINQAGGRMVNGHGRPHGQRDRQPQVAVENVSYSIDSFSEDELAGEDRQEAPKTQEAEDPVPAGTGEGEERRKKLQRNSGKKADTHISVYVSKLAAVQELEQPCQLTQNTSVPDATAEKRLISPSGEQVEPIGTPLQETSPNG